MKNKIIAMTLFAIIGWSAAGSAIACSVLPPVASAVCNKLCENIDNSVARTVCELGQVNHKS